MEAFLTDIGLFFTQGVNWLSAILDLVVSKPALMILVLAMPIVGFVVGLFSRLIRA